MADHMRTELVFDALGMAVAVRGGDKAVAGIICHAGPRLAVRRGLMPMRRNLHVNECMRTTIEFDDDVARAIDDLRRSTGMGVSEAVNHLIRRGLLARPPERPFKPIHRQLGLSIDLSNVADALDLLEGAEAR